MTFIAGSYYFHHFFQEGMAKKIILCGASSVGKTTLANDWCSKYKCFVHIQEVARDVMREHSITRDDMVASLQTAEKKLFLDLQLKILSEQNKRELAVPSHSSFISDRGPDPLIFAQQYVSRDKADFIARSPAGIACLERYRSSLLVVLGPLKISTDDGFRLVPTTDQQKEFTDLLCTFLYQYCVPYLYIADTDHHHRMAILRNAVKGIFPLELMSKSNPVNIPFTLEESVSPSLSLRELQFTIDKVECSFKPFPAGRCNRMVQRYGKDMLILAHFDRKVSPQSVIDLLENGLLVNGDEYNFLGCSSSGLRNRTCYVYKGTKQDVANVIADCGSFSEIQSVSVRLKRIGLLFSEAYPTHIELCDEDVTEVEDITKGDFNFTDGCGAISNHLAQRIQSNLQLEPQKYLPCVFQIRFQGCKGVVMIDPSLRDNEIVFRKSMKKFEPGLKPFPELWVCDHSRPYSYGHLNKQFIMLLSGLGVKDNVFLTKQKEHYRRMECMTSDCTAAFEMLQWNNQPALAARAAAKSTSVDLQSDQLLQKELSKLKSRLVEKMEKLHLLIPESRTVFGVCDPLGVLEYGECFFRPTIRGEPSTLSGLVTVAKNPCYLLGDVRRLTAVCDKRVQQLEHLVDCIVFPTKGKQPHPNEIAGSDLDGDQYFVCWEKDLVIPTTCEPYDYLPGDSKRTSQLKMVQYFAQQNEQSRAMGKIDTFFKYWAERKGIRCCECDRLGMLFAHSVDSAKTGVKVNIPADLVPPKLDCGVLQEQIWTKMEKAVVKEKEQLSRAVVEESIPGAVTEEFVWSLVQDEEMNMSEFEIFNFVKQWCYNQQLSDDKALYKVQEFTDFINFGKFTVDQQKAAIDIGIPREIVSNALNKSHVLTPAMRSHFSLDSPHCGWRFYFHLDSTTFEGHLLLRAIENFSETMLIFQLPGPLIFGLHFLSKVELGTTKLDAGSVAAYLFSPNFALSQRFVLGPQYTLDLDNEMLQLYRGEKKATFVKIAFEDIERSSLDILVNEQISVDLTQFKKDILTKVKHPKVRKEHVLSIEVFVKSTKIEPTYFDVFLADIPEDILYEVDKAAIEEVPLAEEEDEKDVLNLDSSRPYSKEEVLSELHIVAARGNTDHYKSLLQRILSNEKQLSPLCNDLQSSFLALLTSMVASIGYKPTPPEAEDNLQTIIVSLPTSLFQTPLAQLQLLDRLFRLNFSALANEFVEGMKSSSVPDYLEAVSDWRLWCFLPKLSARQVLNKIKPLPVSTSQGKVTSWNSSGTSKDEYCDKDSATVCYILYFVNLLLHHFIDEIHELQMKTCSSMTHKLDQLKIHDLSTQEKEEREVSMTPRKWRLCFSKRTGISSSRFTVGSHVMISPMKVSSKTQVPIVFLGHVVDVTRHPANISLEMEDPIPSSLQLSAKQSKGHWQLTIVGNVTSFKRSLEALQNLFTKKLGSTELLPQLVCPKEWVAEVTKTSTSASADDQNTNPQPHEVVFQYSSFNESQQKAIDAALAKHITLIHGPPGTGKTHVATEIVVRVCQKYSSGKNKVLVTAETNMAVDNLTRKLLQRSVIVVRVGNIEHMSNDVRHASLEHQLQMKRILEKKKGHFACVREILSAAEVIATTCTGAGDSYLKDFSFPFVLIDEATQATEPVSLVPLVHQCRQLVLIGDPQQLPPTLVHSTAGLSESLFHRLHKVLPSFFLEEQHRMHPALAEFPSEKFYSGELKSALTLNSRTSNYDCLWPNKDKPHIFINVEMSREQHYGTSYKNIAEADVVVSVVEKLLSSNVKQTDIVVLTPYSGQVKCIREKLGQVAKCIEVSSVDGFQGREKDIVIFSTVRSSTRMLGFTADKHRINVLLTRAKYGIIGIGCHRALSTDAIWESWLNQVTIEEPQTFMQSVRTGKDIPKGNVHALCKNIRKGCTYGNKCKFAHSQVELDEWNQTGQPEQHPHSGHVRSIHNERSRPRNGVLKLCKFIQQGCRKGDSCTYAHSQAELDMWTLNSKLRKT